MSLFNGQCAGVNPPMPSPSPLQTSSTMRRSPGAYSASIVTKCGGAQFTKEENRTLRTKYDDMTMYGRGGCRGSSTYSRRIASSSQEFATRYWRGRR
ncbi:unnamed protein product [Arctia plantaginis]|uniref:Uncharacterized protein n=1 Tax=Arctia plantaginis TaxID=874455 RepID=A0A8S1AXC0_ARCPL|nr:unnamed protein product [Arctia plantaginis]